MSPVHQLLSGAGPYDAITNQALAYRELFRRWGVDGEVWAAALDPALDGRVRRAQHLERSLRDGDLLVLHYSAHARALEEALELPQRKLLAYHNITPARYLWDHEPYVAMVCALGRARLSSFAGRVDLAVAPSRFSAADLREAGFRAVRTVPNLYLIDRRRLEPGAGAASSFCDGKRNVLFVGRLSANKRQDRLIKAFALYQRHREPDSRLILAGSPGNGAYLEYLEGLVAEAGARDVVFTGGLPQPQLNAIYSDASAFVCLSEHEGFCIPLLEALHFGLPVVAARTSAVPEVLGDAALLLDEPDLPTVAEAIDLAITSAPLCEELARRGRARLADFSFERSEEALRGTVGELL